MTDFSASPTVTTNAGDGEDRVSKQLNRSQYLKKQKFSYVTHPIEMTSSLASRSSHFNAHDKFVICLAAKIATTHCLAHRYTQKLTSFDVDESNSPIPSRTPSPSTSRLDSTNHSKNSASVESGSRSGSGSGSTMLDREQSRANELMKVTIQDATNWLFDVSQQFEIDLNLLPDDPPESCSEGLAQSFRERTSADSSRDKREDVAFELVLISIGLGKTARIVASQEEDKNGKGTAKGWFSKSTPADPKTASESSSTTKAPSQPPPQAETGTEPSSLNYTALSRTLVIRTCHLLGIEEHQVLSAEKIISQALYFELQSKASSSKSKSDSVGSKGEPVINNQEWEQATEAYKKEREGKSNSALRWGVTAAGFVAGGAIIGLTGGLAAPAIAPLLVGTLGFSIFAGSGGIILIGTLLGLGGGGLAGYRTHRRMEGLKEVTFEPIVESDVPSIPSLTATIVVSGFLLDPSDSVKPWLPIYQSHPTDIYAFKIDPQTFLEAGRNYNSWVRDRLVALGGTEMIKHTALAAVYAGVALPLSIYNGATMFLDSDFTRCREKAKKAGILLAEILEKKVQGLRPVILMGYGLGATVIFRCLIELHQRKLGNLVSKVILMGLPDSPGKINWAAARSVVADDLVNCYSANDWTLAIHARMYTLSNRVGGLTKVEVEGVRDVDVSDLVQGHLELREKIGLILERVEKGEAGVEVVQVPENRMDFEEKNEVVNKE